MTFCLLSCMENKFFCVRVDHFQKRGRNSFARVVSPESSGMIISTEDVRTFVVSS